jgi:hypothetical protein
LREYRAGERHELEHLVEDRPPSITPSISTTPAGAEPSRRSGVSRSLMDGEPTSSAPRWKPNISGAPRNRGCDRGSATHDSLSPSDRSGEGSIALHRRERKRADDERTGEVADWNCDARRVGVEAKRRDELDVLVGGVEAKDARLRCFRDLDDVREEKRGRRGKIGGFRQSRKETRNGAVSGTSHATPFLRG